MSADLDAPELYLNRELSWLEFNKRVLSLAQRADVPPLERLKFVAICASNLDEFYMVRVGGLERYARDPDSFDVGPDGMRPRTLLKAATDKARGLGQQIAEVLTESVIPELKNHGVEFLFGLDLDGALREEVHHYYQTEVHPCLTPIAIDPSHPFPRLRNHTLNIALRIAPIPRGDEDRLEQPSGELLAIVQVPSVLPRFVQFPKDDQSYRFMALEAVISMFVDELFPGHRVLEAAAFRVTRASDLDISEDEAEDLLTTIKDELRRRERGEPVRLELSSHTSDTLVEQLSEMIGVQPRQIHRQPGFVATAALFAVYRMIDLPHIKDEAFSPVVVPPLQYTPTIFRSISERDVLLHHPYDTFRHVVDFIEQAADDPDVVAIKQTLYRTSGDSPIVRALARAAAAGKQVTALIELKARFDEAANIAWAESLEESGVHVVYGLIGLKTHCKLLLVIRREGEKLKRYVHVATGNYNPTTANLYTDLGMFTAREDITADAMVLFNILTGYAELPPMKRLMVAPFTLRAHVLEQIERELEAAKAGKPCGIVAKMNALVDDDVIRALYRASMAGVPIDLMIRGICCLRPGVPGVSENIRVHSIVDRFLEHSRVFWWKSCDELYLSSADWMPRNLNRRIEVAFPVLDPSLRKRITEDMLKTEFEDNTFAWALQPDGQYAPYQREGEPTRSQSYFIDQAKQRAVGQRTAVRPELSQKALRLSPAVRAAEAQLRRLRTEELSDS